ncbi:MAG: hypothetical protein JO257_21760, partial [Deltaproteobacteria bacterium]|nr:hypothetical protein [Deltaproteobacteria bacterium]
LRLLGVEETLRRIRGMFAFAYYEPSTQTLWLCRDRLGIKPLHYVSRGDVLYFSSEVKGIAAVLPLAIDPVRALFSIASVADDSLDRTCFRGVKQVPPGAALVCRRGHEPEVRRYYSPIDDFDEAYYRELDSAPEAHIVETFLKLFTHAVERTLMSDVRLGAFVSGGIDSSLVVAIARKTREDIPLFSADIAGEMSEIDDARRLASHLSCELHEVRFEPGQLLQEWARATWHYEYPIVRHVNAIPFMTVARLARSSGTKVVLTGEGADELFLGYPKLLARRFERIARGPVDTMMNLYGKLPGLREFLWPQLSPQPTDFLSLLAQDFQRQRIREPSLQKLAFLGEEGAREQYLTLEMLQESLHSLLHRNDRMGMAHSIEARFPFLDEELLRFGISLPAKFKIHRSTRFHNFKHPFLEDKWVTRAAARDLLPRELVHKRKNGFPMPGYRVVKVKPSFFRGGYVEDALSLSCDTADYITRRANPMHVARLAAVDLHGRLFEQGWSIQRATEHVLQHADAA